MKDSHRDVVGARRFFLDGCHHRGAMADLIDRLVETDMNTSIRMH